ncbi:MAG: lysozyme inhibitor LprI family protein [Candidatus Sericytochromatia bacterium]
MRHAFTAVLVLTGLIVAPWTPPAMAATVNEELEAEYKTEDAALNAAYKKLMARLSPVAKQRLTASELAWITFRDAQRHADADEYRGGTMAATAALACKIRLTTTRTKDLQLWLKRLDAPVFTGLNPQTRERALSQQKGAHAQADHLLNQAYKAVLAPQDAAGRKLTTQAQLAWLAFRDKELAFAEAFAGSRGEVALVRQLALTELTGSRAEDLRAIVDERESH